MKLDARPDLLSDYVPCSRSNPVTQGRVVAYPRYWQVPAATEKAAYEALLPNSESLDFAYVGFPWATVIDGLRNEAATIGELLRALAAIRKILDDGKIARRATVAQHIHADKFIEMFRACGITHLFWSHAQVTHRDIGGVAIHPFPLFPAQTPEGAEAGDVHRHRPFLANFIGAFNPKVYLTDVRQHIFGDAGSAPDLIIVKREDWHFNRVVYDEQMKGMAPDAARLKLEAQHKEEYLQAIRDSAFTLCPSGSGPNSIRIGEALALGSIPIILTRSLALPGDPALWEAVCLIEEDSADGYRKALARARDMPEAELRERQRTTGKLFAAIGPKAFGDLIVSAMQVRQAEDVVP